MRAGGIVDYTEVLEFTHCLYVQTIRFDCHFTALNEYIAIVVLHLCVCGAMENREEGLRGGNKQAMRIAILFEDCCTELKVLREVQHHPRRGR